MAEGRALEGKVVIVTGAGRGLGREYAHLFAADGATVVVADVQMDGAEATAKDVAAAGGQARAVPVDVTDEASTLALAADVAATEGRIDVLVNNAGIWGDLDRTPLVSMDVDYWNFVLAVNLTGPFLCSRAVIPAMTGQGWGRIVNISSMGAFMKAGVYGVSKLAVNQLTWALAAEVGDSGITVNAVAPGTIGNDATRQQVPEAALERLVAQNAVKREGTAADVYGMIRYLVSDDAEWVTGQTFMVNGGYSSRL